MCLQPKMPKQQMISDQDPRATADAQAELAARRSAFGFDATLMGGLAQPAAQPSLSRQLFVGSGG